HRIARSICTVDRDFDIVARRLIDHSIVLRCARRELRLCFVQFPCAHKLALGEAHSNADEAQRHRQHYCSCLHVLSCTGSKFTNQIGGGHSSTERSIRQHVTCMRHMRSVVEIESSRHPHSSAAGVASDAGWVSLVKYLRLSISEASQENRI